MSEATFTLRAYAPADEDAAIELWRRSWQQTSPDIDFAARVPVHRPPDAVGGPVPGVASIFWHGCWIRLALEPDYGRAVR